jgi:hypothetical protein
LRAIVFSSKLCSFGASIGLFFVVLSGRSIYNQNSTQIPSIFFIMNTVKISALVSSEERQMIQARAAQSGLSLSKYLTITALTSMPDIETLKTLYLKAGEAHTLAHLVMDKQDNPAENSVEEIQTDLADLIQAITRIHALTKELMDSPHAGKAIQRT